MGLIFKGKPVKEDDILSAMDGFDAQYPDSNSYDAWLDKDTYKFAVLRGGKVYPCKYILSQATGIDVSEFGGGKQTNNVFRKLGFTVVDK